MRYFRRLNGRACVEDAIDDGGEGCHLYSQPSVSVCGTAEMSRIQAVAYIVREAERLETEAAKLRAEADAILTEMRGA